MKGMEKGAPGLVKLATDQAELTNLPRVGSDVNVAHPNVQINIASARDYSETGGGKITSLGKFGEGHVDVGDGCGLPTAMTIWTEETDEILEDYFYLLDMGIGWLNESLSTLFFNGLHFHGGSQPMYRRDRKDPTKIVTRVSEIHYNADLMMSGKDTLAFATLANKIVLPIGYDFRKPAT